MIDTATKTRQDYKDALYRLIHACEAGQGDLSAADYDKEIDYVEAAVDAAVLTLVVAKVSPNE